MSPGEHLPAGDLGRAVPARVDQHAAPLPCRAAIAGGSPGGPSTGADGAVVALALGQAPVEQQPAARAELREHRRRAPADEHVAVGLHARAALVGGEDRPGAGTARTRLTPLARSSTRSRSARDCLRSTGGPAELSNSVISPGPRAARVVLEAEARALAHLEVALAPPRRQMIDPSSRLSLYSVQVLRAGDDQVAVGVGLDGVDVEVVPRARALGPRAALLQRHGAERCATRTARAPSRGRPPGRRCRPRTRARAPPSEAQVALHAVVGEQERGPAVGQLHVVQVGR